MSEERRTRLLQLGAGAVFLTVAVVLVLIVLQTSSNDGSGDAQLEDVALVNGGLAGIPQRGLVLGSPDAPVELVEYGDLQCPVCKGYAEDVLPPVIESQVETGKAKLAFRNFPIIDELSVPAGAAALAAGAQGRGWNFIEIFYRNQGKEGTDYVSDEFLTAIAKAAGVKDLARWNRERRAAKLTKEVETTGAEAEQLGFTGTPSFAIEGPGTNGRETLGTPSGPDELEAAIEAAA